MPGLGRRPAQSLSGLESCAWNIFRWNQDVFDIKTQFALELETTQRIADEMGVRHPFNHRTNKIVVMTTDLVIYYTIGSGSRRAARSVKPQKKLEIRTEHTDKENKHIRRNLEKLEIERRYWEVEGVDWQMLTDAELSAERGMNIEHMINVELDPTRPAGFWQDAADAICAGISANDGSRLVDLQKHLADEIGLEEQYFTTCLRYLISSRHVAFDMDRQFLLTRPVSDFWLVAAA